MNNKATKKLGVVMDPIAEIHAYKDSTLAMLLEAQARDYIIYAMQQADLFLDAGKVRATVQQISVYDDNQHWFDVTDELTIDVDILDVLLMRKDPPFDIEYIYTSYLLELAEHAGVLVVNKPQSLRDYNEKLVTAWFPQCCPPTLVTRQKELLHNFQQQHHAIVLKPLEGMGGKSVYLIKPDDLNTNTIIEDLTHNGTRYIMAQRFIPEISQGDKRILLINGEPIPQALTRIPAPGESRGNLAVGAKGIGVDLTARDIWICEQLKPMLQQKGLLFVGIDVIGDYLTEINITSPTGIREIDKLFGVNVAGTLFDAIEQM